MIAVYYQYKHYEGIENHLDVTFGSEFKIFPEKLHFVANWIYNNEKVNLAVLGLIFYANKNLPLSFGWQIRNRNTPQALIFELIYILQ